MPATDGAPPPTVAASRVKSVTCLDPPCRRPMRCRVLARALRTVPARTRTTRTCESAALDATPHPESAVAACPFHGGDSAPVAPVGQAMVAPHDVLDFPLHRRVVTHVSTDAGTGARELHLFHGEQEISFDEESLFAFGETLATRARFVAQEALGWGDGYDWQTIGPLLQVLVDEGILRHATGAAATRVDTGARPSPLPAAPCAQPRFWDADGALLAELTGRALEIGHLELVMPVFRVAHCALDSEGRQVGESNVFPKALRLDVPTRWRACIYPGSRHQSERPMNVTALKSMRAHWPAMMQALAAVRSAYLLRFPQAAAGWTVGHVEQLATMVLALPTHALVRTDAPVANGALDPVLSSLFRVADGLRMVMHQMMFVPIGEPTLAHDAPIDSASILAFAERNHSFHSEHGVCAGPRAMIEEFLAVLLDGRVSADARHIDGALEAALAAMAPAMDYGLRGLRVHVSLFSSWPAMARTYARLAAVVEQAGVGAPRALQQRFAGHVAALQAGSYLATEQWRTEREHGYAGIFAGCGAGLNLAPRDNDLRARILAARRPLADAAVATMHRAWRRCVARAASAEGGTFAVAAAMADTLAAPLAEIAVDYVAELRAILAVAIGEQQALNRQLGRPAPRQAFDAAAADLHNHLQAAERRLPFLVDELAALLGLRLQIDAERVVIDDDEPARGAQHARATPAFDRLQKAGGQQDSDGTGPTEDACSVHAPLRRKA